MTHKLLAIVASLTVGCGAAPDAKTPSPDAASADGPNSPRLPAWMLEDIQPQSPRAGQTYGLQTFAGKIVVVTLLEGF